MTGMLVHWWAYTWWLLPTFVQHCYDEIVFGKHQTFLVTIVSYYEDGASSRDDGIIVDVGSGSHHSQDLQRAPLSLHYIVNVLWLENGKWQNLHTGCTKSPPWRLQLGIPFGGQKSRSRDVKGWCVVSAGAYKNCWELLPMSVQQCSCNVLCMCTSYNVYDLVLSSHSIWITIRMTP